MKQTASHRKNLLELDRLPTKEELRAFFLSNDWTTDKPYDFSKWESEQTEELNYAKSVLAPVWNETAKKYGQKAPSVCYTDDDHDGKCDHCGENLGTHNPSENCTCACHKKGIAKFFFKIGLFFQKIFKKNRICKCGVWHY